MKEILAYEAIKDIPILIFGTKVDLQSALTEEQLAEVLEISSQRTGKDKHLGPVGKRPLELFMHSILKKGTILEGFRVSLLISV